MAHHDSELPPGTAAALEQLGRLSLGQHSMETVLQAVADQAKVVLPGSTEASVLLLVDDHPSTVVHTGQVALDCDEVQYGTGHGPCMHAARAREQVEVTDTRTDSRWRDYMDFAAGRGVDSSLSVPLVVDESTSGALNVYAREPRAFDETSRAVVGRFAPYAGVAIANMSAYRNAREMADNLEVALASRAVIDQAKGILVERHRLTPDQALQLLAQASMRANAKLRDVAEALVHSGELPLR